MAKSKAAVGIAPEPLVAQTQTMIPTPISGAGLAPSLLSPSLAAASVEVYEGGGDGSNAMDNGKQPLGSMPPDTRDSLVNINNTLHDSSLAL